MLSLEAVAAADAASKRMLRAYSLFSRCDCVFSRESSARVIRLNASARVSCSSHISTVGYGKNYLSIPPGAPLKLLGPKTSVVDRPRGVVDPLEYDALRANGSSDWAEKGSARPGSSQLVIATVLSRIGI